MRIDELRVFLKPTGFAKTIAENLAYEGLAIYDETLEILHEDIYKIENERLSLLGLPSFFEGYIGVKMNGTPNMSYCGFETTFANSKGKVLSDFEILGSILSIKAEKYILPKSFFDLTTAIKKADNTNEEYDRWAVINIAKNSGDKIKFEGLPSEDDVMVIDKIGIDIVPNGDGSIHILPQIGRLSYDTVNSYRSRLEEEARNGIVFTQIDDGKIKRVSIPKKAMEAARRIYKKQRIEKEDVPNFFSNPQASLLEGEEEPSETGFDFSGNFRIVGVGEPYVGYFGSIPLDSPIARILRETCAEVILKQARQTIADECARRSKEEILGALFDVEDAIRNNFSKLKIFDIEFLSSEFDTIKNELKKNIKEDLTNGNILSNESSKLVLKIKYNDDESIDYACENQKHIEQISVNNMNAGALFENINFKPKSYQIAGVNWLVELYENKFPGGILADDMGLGKTYQLITFFSYLLKNNEKNRILVVTPAILIENWQSEIQKFIKDTKSFNVRILRGKDLSYRAIKGKSFNTFNVEDILQDYRYPTIILTTYQTLTNYQFSFAENNKWGFECVVFDEAHSLKNPSSQQSQAARAIAGGIKFKVLLTGTPIENELKDLWALFDIFNPSHFGSWKKFKEEFIKSSQNDLDDKLRSKCSNYVLRRLKKDYLIELPPKEEKIYKIALGKDEDGYLSILNSGSHALIRMKGLKDFCLHRVLADKTNKVNSILQDGILRTFSKTNELLRILNEIKSKNEKVIIFALNRLAQDMLKHHLEIEFPIKISVINGDSNKASQVEKSLKNFKNTDGFGIIILSPLAAGVGLTITEANHVIHFERWWNASKEDQASDRVFRIGQTRKVFIHHILVTLTGKTSFDEALHQLITTKRETAGFLVPPKGINESDLASSMGFSVSNEEMLDNHNGDSFEDFVLLLYSKMGYECVKTPKPEYGVDILAKNGNEKLAIQCKYSQNGKPRDKEGVRQLIAEADYYKPTKKIAVTNSIFENGARQLAFGNGIELVERDTLLLYMKEYLTEL